MVDHKKLGDMQAKQIVGEYKEATLTHYDGHTRKVLYTDIETTFPEGREKINSITSVDGFITQVNSTFVHMSGYSRDELIGMPHYVLRHPDMPKVAFKGLWDTLASEGRWSGYVKNLRKDGGFYWVHADVFSLKRNGQLVGYTSSRGPAEPEKIAECTALYKQMLQAEQGK